MTQTCLDIHVEEKPVDNAEEYVHLVDSSSVWLERGQRIVDEIAQALIALPADVEHIGSTAVLGLAAKPIIDIQVGCPTAAVDEVIAVLVGLGFEHLGESGVSGREYLRRRTEPAVNIHVVERHGHLWADNIAFRDYLRAHPAAARVYEVAKRDAARQATTLSAYSALKAAILTQLLAHARRHSAGDTAR